MCKAAPEGARIAVPLKDSAVALTVVVVRYARPIQNKFFSVLIRQDLLLEKLKPTILLIDVNLAGAYLAPEIEVSCRIRSFVNRDSAGNGERRTGGSKGEDELHFESWSLEM